MAGFFQPEKETPLRILTHLEQKLKQRLSPAEFVMLNAEHL